jgi:hypothetical protein
LVLNDSLFGEPTSMSASWNLNLSLFHCIIVFKGHENSSLLGWKHMNPNSQTLDSWRNKSLEFWEAKL